MRTTNFDRLATSAPLNADAAIARDGVSNDHWEAKIGSTVNRWIAPPAMKPMSDMSDIGRAMCAELVGARFGRLRVLGIWADGNRKKGASWVVRCDCGYYEARKANSLRAGTATCCTACDRLDQLRAIGSSKNTAASREASASHLDQIATASRGRS